VNRWNFCKADCKRFCLLTGESVWRLPPLDTLNIETTYQDFGDSLLSTGKQCIPCGRQKNYAPCWRQRMQDPLSLCHPSLGGDTSSLLSWLEEKQERWEEAVNTLASGSIRGNNCWFQAKIQVWYICRPALKVLIPSTSRTLAARHGEPTNLLVSLDTPLACAPSQRTPSIRNLWTTGDTRLWSTSPPGSSTSSCQSYGRFQHLRSQYLWSL